MYTRKSYQNTAKREYFYKDRHEFMYTVVLLIHPRQRTERVCCHIPQHNYTVFRVKTFK